MKKSMDMLNGSIWDKVILFALPLAATSILQQLFNSADVAVVGRFAGSNALAAVGVNSPIINLMINLFVGMSVGANVITAKYIGARNKEKANSTVHTALVLSVIFGVFLAVAGNILAIPLLKVLNTPEDIVNLAALYLRIYFAGMPFIMLYNFENAIYRSKGDTRMPLVVLIAAGVLNVGLNLFFVAVCGMTVDGVAIATVISNAASAVILLIMLKKDDEYTRFELKKAKIDSAVLKKVIQIGIPAGIQSMVFSVSNMFVMSANNSLGSLAVAGNTVSSYLDVFCYFLVDSFSQAATSFVGQNYGAGQFQRCRKITRISLFLGLIFGTALAGIFMIMPRTFLGLYTQEQEVLDIAMVRLTIVIFFAGSAIIYSLLGGVLRAYGYSMTPAVISVFSICGSRLIWIYTLFQKEPTFKMLCWAYPVSWMLCNVAMLIAYLIIIPKVKEKFEKVEIA